MIRSVLLYLAFAAWYSAWPQAREMKEGYQQFNDLQFHTAAASYQEAIEKMTDEDRAQKNFATFMLAECHRMMNDYDIAELHYKTLVETDFGNTNPVIYLRWAQVLRSSGMYQEAKTYYQKYLREDPRSQAGKMGVRSCDWLMANAHRRARVDIYHTGRLNTPYDDFAPATCNDDFSKLVITSNRTGSTGKKQDEWWGTPFSDLFVSSLSGNTWSEAVQFDLIGNVNTELHEGAAAFNRDRSRIYFTRCEKWDEKKRYCAILVSEIRDDSIQEPKILFADTNTNFGQPSVSGDELKIVFSSGMKDGEGGKDLYEASRKSMEEPFGKPVNLGSAVNSFGNEMFPHLFQDTLLFFASDGFEGYGGLDIYRSVYRNGGWSKPENLLRPINSGYDDFAMIVRIPGEEGFFTSNRPGGQGGDDIYRFTRRILQFTVSGKVKDHMSLLPLEGVQVFLIGERKDTALALSDARGAFSFDNTQVLEESAYHLSFRKENYFAGKDSVDTRPLEDDYNFSLNISLDPIPEKPIVLPDILYPLDEWILLPQYQDSLRGLVTLLDENPSLVIELRSHTDSRASFEYNDLLSQKRAQSVVDFLITEGIDPGRLVARGYGERVFRILDKDVIRDGFTFKKGTELNDEYIYSLPSKEIQEAAFQLNRRTEFAVIAKDYKSAGKPGDTQSPVIRVVSDSTVVTVDYTLDDDGRMRMLCYLNDFAVNACLAADSLQSTIDPGIVEELLRKGAVDRNDFEGDFDKIMIDDKIMENSVLNIDKARIGELVINGVTLRVRPGPANCFLMGRDMMGMFGKYTVDKEKSQLIFE